MPNVETILLIVALMFLLSITASKASVRFGIPALLLFAIIGMLAGSDGPGGIYFDHPWATQFVGVLALGLILFDAGMETDVRAIRPVAWPGISLATIGLVFSAVLVALFSRYVLGWHMREALLLGAIVSSTDAAAVFNVFRSQRLKLKGNLNPLIELESGSNDPMAVLLTVVFIRLIVEPDIGLAGIALQFVIQLVAGGALGYVFGRLTTFIVNSINLEWEGLYPVLTVTMALLTYSVTAAVGGNGFLAVYISGLILGRGKLIHRTTLRFFHDALAWLMQIAMFLVLGLQVYPSKLPQVTLAGLGIALFLMFVARPASVFAALIGAGIPSSEKLLISWAGLRGAAPIVLATFPQLAGVARSDTIFNIVFFVALTSLLLQGTTVSRFARLLRLEVPTPRGRAFPLLFNPSSVADGELLELHVESGSTAENRRVVDLKLPTGVLLLSVTRGEELVVPQGGTILKAGDKALVLLSGKESGLVRETFENSRPHDH